ncbi:uncharacterized protein LOC129777736 [Toxorhynchites rutilus septentrionalis]|uniref:uncharacterized protein LOC129777736 n=1 Tax=Toxorhynchites rutilus septentrionalis TaxID=329112 RepID=UPI0024783535|nr:uncharacterized protein LOC129777736 [Toxorhynchites rutilus septentrionalis]
MEPRSSATALFREIHKNTWLRRLNVEGKRPSVLAKKADRYWVVFCVHDDCEAFLEGYLDPRQAPSHNPEWSISLQSVQHISHALVPMEQEFEFVITFSNEIARFNANTWECMQEWVESLRTKLREMKLLSPKENLYSKLPEIKPPLAPTRDPTSPLPATPPVPAAIVPGIERVQPSSLQTVQPHHPAVSNVISSAASSLTSSVAATSNVLSASTNTTSSVNSTSTHVPPATAMSNTSTQNLMNLLTNPLQAVSSINNQHISSQHLFDAISIASDLSDTSLDDYSNDHIKSLISSSPLASPPPIMRAGSTSVVIPASSSSSSSSSSTNLPKAQKKTKENGFHQQQQAIASQATTSSSLATTFVNNVLADPGTTSLKRTTKKVLKDAKADDFMNDSEGDEDADASNFTNGSISSSSCCSNSSIGVADESGNESSLLSSLAVASHPPTDPITQQSSSPSYKTRHGHRNDPKKTRRKSPPECDHSSANVTIIQVSNETDSNASPVQLPLASPKARIRTQKAELNAKISNGGSSLITDDLSDDNFKSNVQIIPSNIEYDHHFHHHRVADLEPSIIASINDRQITTVKVSNLVNDSNNSGSGSNVTVTSAIPPKVQPTVIATAATSSTPIKSDSNFGTVTQISVNSSDESRTPPQQQHYEQVFLLPSPVHVVNSQEHSQSPPACPGGSAAIKLNKSKVVLLSKQQRSSSHSEIHLNHTRHHRNVQGNKENQGETSSANGQPCVSSSKMGLLPSVSSPAVPSSNMSPSKRGLVDNNIYTPHPQRPVLQRGLTEMVISRSTNAVVIGGRDQGSRGRQPSSVPVNPPTEKIRNEINEQRRRSSSTSDAHAEAAGNPTPRTRLNGASRLQSPPQPFRPHHQLISQLDPLNGSGRKMTLREQQVMQLRREMMHPGGVRLQLRRKDCINSIGLVDAFGAVWVAGWKQKEHPVLYNALHIGDQLISVAGVPINCATEAHKAIRGAPGLFVELIIRRIPFGRVYAIRRELEGQCLGLIRDGNTATIVDVVPNSLAARHGLPPKAQSCDSLSLTFWVLTEINGRPLNLFFKDNEIRDRLNAVGRDISILVQPADLVTKLKKQLKSLRGHKDFIVQ